MATGDGCPTMELSMKLPMAKLFMVAHASRLRENFTDSGTRICYYDT